MSRVTFHRLARRELTGAGEYFERQAPGRGDDFLDTTIAVAELIRTMPQLGAPGPSDTRRLPIGRFPYSLVYIIRKSGPQIVAIAHHRRRPAYWRDRLR